MNLETLQDVLFGCMVLNLGFLAFSALLIISFQPWIARMHGRFFRLPEKSISQALYIFIGFYKIIVIVIIFNVVPWVAIQLIT